MTNEQQILQEVRSLKREVRRLTIQPQPEQKFLTVLQTARKLNCCERTVINYITRGELGATKPKGRWLIPQSSITKFLQK